METVLIVQAHEKAASHMAKAQRELEKAQHGKYLRPSPASMISTDNVTDYQAAQAKEQHSSKEYAAAVEEHKRLHAATEQAKAHHEKISHDVSSLAHL